MFSDKLEKLFEETPKKTFFKDLFGGKLVYQVISKECEHTSERTEPFYTLSLAVKEKKN